MGSPNFTKALGNHAEDLAAAFFVQRGYVILVRNWRRRRGEIDLILQDGATVVFVEVKARTSGRFGLPQEAVTPRKQRQIMDAAQDYLQTRGWLDRPVRFDVLAIRFDGSTDAFFEHIPEAFGEGG